MKNYNSAVNKQMEDDNQKIFREALKDLDNLFRPEWCPYKDCKQLRQFSNLMCVGGLPKPEAHREGENTHRFCIDERETGHGIHDLQVHNGDAWLIKLLMESIMENHEKEETQRH